MMFSYSQAQSQESKKVVNLDFNRIESFKVNDFLTFSFPGQFDNLPLYDK